MAHYELAQLNIAELIAPIDSPQLAEFVANLDRINALADTSPGFVWRLQDDIRQNAMNAHLFGQHVIVNMSTWRDIPSLHQFVYRSAHTDIMRQKTKWFAPMSQAHMVLWWVPQGHHPSKLEARKRLDRLRQQGPTPEAFTFKKRFEMPELPVST